MLKLWLKQYDIFKYSLVRKVKWSISQYKGPYFITTVTVLPSGQNKAYFPGEYLFFPGKNGCFVQNS